MIPISFRKDLSIEGLLSAVRRSFSRIKFTQSSRGIDKVDALMSGLAIFGIKYPSLLQFDRDVRTDEVIRLNLHNLYGVKKAPCDTHLRELLDDLEPTHLRRAFKALFALLQRGKGLEDMAYLNGRYLASIDGTGYFSSPIIHCGNCCEEHHRNGQITYYHQMLGAVLVHPDCPEVFPLAPEPILKQDGSTKNDCERNASKRLLCDLKREHPHLKLIVVEDGLASNAPPRPKGKQQHFSWVTDIPITPQNLMKLMRGGRARWHIENQTFNTLKNQGYHFEHNFGHGYKNLSTVFAFLMLLAFLIDQIQQHCCPLFRRALEKVHCKLYYWNHIRALFLEYEVPSWEILYKGLAFGFRKSVLQPYPDTS